MENNKNIKNINAANFNIESDNKFDDKLDSKKKLKPKKGILIVIEGLDSSGKETQVKMLYDKFLSKNLKVMKLQFPDYDSESSTLVKMYLNGKLGSDPVLVNPYAASLFFASDRYISYKLVWENYLEDGGIVIADRYVTSNMIYQAAKFEENEQRLKFLDWLYDLEFNKLNLPKPDIVIFLNMPIKYCLKLGSNRLNKITGLKEKDIHEKNINYLLKTNDVAIEAAKIYKWEVINCIKDSTVKSIEDINKEILKIIENKLDGDLKF
jgi:dTMP kinase